MSAFVEEVDPQHAAWLVYLNGIQVPCPSVTVTYGVWQIPEATISFAPHKLLQRLGAEDRLEVTIFYLDNYYEPENPTFRLLFEGEILGWSYSSSPMGRMITFNALADISIYQALYFFFMNTVDAIIGYKTTPGANANTPFTAGVHYPFSIFKKGLFLKAETDRDSPDIEKPYDILANILTGIISGPPDEGADTRPIPCVNFFMRWARKRNFQNRFVAMPLFEDTRINLDELPENSAIGGKRLGAFPLFQSVQAEYALKAMSTSLAETVGEQGSIYDMLQKVFGMSYCELAMIPTAPMVIADVTDGKILQPPSTPRDQGTVSTQPYRLVNYFAKPQMLFGSVPSCNLIFPSLIRNYTYSENFWQQPTRVYVNDQFFTAPLNKTGIVASATTVGYPEAIDAVLQLRRQTTDSDTATRYPTATGKNVLAFPEEFFKGPVLNRMPVPMWFSHLANARAAEARSAASPETTVESPPVDKDLHDLYFLYSQYEYFRTRYEQRGGAVDLIWNPYVVPGFPCMTFDHRASAMDTVGYVMTVRQTMASTNGGGEMTTSLNYSYGRTFQELIETMKTDMSRLGVVLSSAPVEPVDSVRAITQDFEYAEEMYRILFHRDSIEPGKQAAVDIRTIVGFVDKEDEYGDEAEVTPISIKGTAVARDVTYLGTGADGRTPPTTNLDATKDVEPLKTMEPAFKNPISALRYVARPICTLDEYITFIHGGESIEALKKPATLTDPVTKESYVRPAQVEGENNEFSYAEITGRGENAKIVKSSARYYTRIRALIQGPGDVPPSTQTGAKVTDVAGKTTADALAEIEKVEPLPVSAPQTRYDWDQILLAYRAEILTRLSPMR